LLIKVYLHYVFDRSAERWRRCEATGDVIIVRYAGDFLVGFQHEADARRFWDNMRKRFEEFSLSLNPDKTRLIESAALQGNDALSVGLASRRPSTSSASPSSANATDVSNYS
jgi:hypothetical protein